MGLRRVRMTIEYLINPSFCINRGFECNCTHIKDAALSSNNKLKTFPFSLFQSIDYKTSSTIVGRIFCECLSEKTGAIVNPIEKGHPDIIPIEGINASERELRNYPLGIEVKSTVGNVIQGSKLKPGNPRINLLNGITWQAHHREVNNLLGIIWDFNYITESKSPIISGIFYSNELSPEDWGAISGTTGRNTKVTAMLTSGKHKMGRGWILILQAERYIEIYQRILDFHIK